MVYHFSSDWSLSFVRKETVQSMRGAHFSKMSNFEHRVVIKFFTRKGLTTSEINKELEAVYHTSAPSYRTVAKWVSAFKDPERDFEDAPRPGRPITTITDENVKAVEHIVMRDRQASVRHVAAELRIPITTAHYIMTNWLVMRKVCTRWVPKVLTPLQRANRVDCCHELLHASEEDPAAYLSRIVTGLCNHQTHFGRRYPSRHPSRQDLTKTRVNCRESLVLSVQTHV